MARQVLPIVGAVVGSFFGAPQLGFVLGSVVGNIVDPQVIKGPSLGDGQQTVSQEGAPRPIIYGTGCVGGNIIAKGELVKKKKRKRQGKGGPVQETEHFYMTYAIRICEGPIDGLIRIWEDEKLVYDVRKNGSLVDGAENSKYKQNFKLYLGGEDQVADPDLEVVFGVGDTPAFRGTAYIVFPNRDLTERNGSVPTYRFEVTTSAVGDPAIGTNVAAQRTEMALIGDDLILKSLNDNSLTHPTYYTNFNFSYDGKYIAGNHTIGFYTQRIKVLKYNDITQKFDIEIPFEEGNLPSPRETSDFGDSHNRVTPFFHKQSNTLFVQLGGYVDVYAIENDVLVYKSSAPRVDAPDSSSKWTANINYFKQNESGNRILGFANAVHFYSFDKNTYTMTYLNSSEVGPGTVLNTTVPDSKSDFLNNRLVVRHSTYLRLYQLDTLSNTFTLIAQASGIPSSSGSRDNVCFSKNGAQVFTLKDNVDGDTLITGFNIVGSLGVLPFEFVEIPSITQPTTKISGGITQRLVTNNQRDHFITETYDDGVGGYAVYRYNGGSLDLVDELTIAGGASPGLAMADVEVQEGIEGGPWDVKDIILDIADRLKINSNKIDVSDIDEFSCDGLIVAQQYTGGNVIRKLQEIFFFDPSEYDKKLNFIKRGKPAIKAITFEECVADSYEAERKNAIEYPRKIELMYQNARIGYVAAKAVAERISPEFFISGTQTFESPVVLNEDKAAQAVDKMHKVSWADAEGEVKFSLPTDFQDLVVADCIGFYMRDTVQRLRIETIETADGVMNITARVDRQSAYTSNVTGLPLPDPTPPPGTITGITVWAYLDIPALVDNNDALLYYYAGTGATEAWHGYVMQRSELEGDFDDVGSSSSAEGVGYLTQAINNASEHYIDNTNEILVQMYNDVNDFESITDEQLLNEKNAIAICRDDGSAEIIQYRDAEYLENNLWRLTHLIRGRLNSKTSSHAVNAQVVILDTVNVAAVNSPLLNKNIEHRAVSYDSSPEDADIRNYVFAGRSQIEFPVDLLSVENDGTNINVSWSPRERFGTDLAPVRSINWQNYEIEISDGTTTQTLYSLLPSAQFLTADFSGIVTVNVWQINRFTGRGEVASAVINV